MAFSTNKNLSDSQILSLFIEHKFKKNQISQLLKELKDRDYDSVMDFIKKKQEEYNITSGNKSRDLLKKLEKEKEQSKIEEEYKKMYRQRVLDKINANRAELLKEDELENESNSEFEKRQQLQGNGIFIKVLVDEKSEIILDFDKHASINDLYKKLKDKLKVKEVILMTFNKGGEIKPSNDLLIDKFKVTGIMLSATTK